MKELTLWQYEELIDKLLEVLGYEFVQKAYDQKLAKTRKMVRGLLKYRSDAKYEDYSEKVEETLRQIEIFGMHNIAELIESIRDKNDCTNFIQISGILFNDLISFLNCCLRWILPFPRPIREFIDVENKPHLEYLLLIRKRGIKNNLDMIEECRTVKGRQTLAVLSEVPMDFIVDLTHRADISRLPYIRGKTVTIFHNAGFRTLEDIANTSVDDFVAQLEKSLESEGKKFSRSFIDPEGAVAQARIIPALVEE